MFPRSLQTRTPRWTRPYRWTARRASLIFSRWTANYTPESLRNRGTGPACFSARLMISPGEIPSAKAKRPRVSMEGVVLPCSKYVINDRARPVRTDSSFFDRPRASRSFVSSPGSAFFKRSAHSSAPMDRHGERGAAERWGSIFRPVKNRATERVYLTHALSPPKHGRLSSR